MQDPQQIWEFGRWIARRNPGSIRLSWTEGEIELGVRQGRVHTATGLDVGELAYRLNCDETDEAELLAAARVLGSLHDIPETRAVGTAKELLQEGLHRWLMDPEREFSVVDGEPGETDGATISITHALVELVLADTAHNVAEKILPDRNVVLQRSPGFLDLYAPLRLSEEADLIVAGITASKTAEQIADDSPHHPDEVVRLIAALVATGALEITEPVTPAPELDWSGADLDSEESDRRKIPIWMIGAAAALLVIVLAVAIWLLVGGDDGQPSDAVAAGDWGVVVEMGCEPQDLQRMLRKRNLERKALRTVKADPSNGDTCFRLVWGSFPTKDAAEEAMTEVPDNLVEEGFQPHVIEVARGDESADLEAGD